MSNESVIYCPICEEPVVKEAWDSHSNFLINKLNLMCPDCMDALKELIDERRWEIIERNNATQNFWDTPEGKALLEKYPAKNGDSNA